MSYIYENDTTEDINIGGYQFSVGQKLESNIRIEDTLNGFHFDEAVKNNLLSLTDDAGGSTTKEPEEPPEDPPEDPPEGPEEED